jgi:hypothetical protein
MIVVPAPDTASAAELRTLAADWEATQLRHACEIGESAERRMALIRRRREGGASLRQIAAESELTASGVRWLLGRAEEIEAGASSDA